jgi:hypothetical protein
MRIEAGVGDLVQRTGDGKSTDQVLGGQTIERLGDVVCDLQRAQGDEEHGFLGLASKPRSTVSPGLASKPVATVLVVGPQNHSLEFSQFEPQNQQLRFGDLAHRSTMTVSWFVPQNQVGYGLSITPQN